MIRVDLNCDMGEAYGNYASLHDAEIMPYISSCNIACGFHSGDPLTISKTIELALRYGVAIGAHPSFPDLQGFGRRMMHLSGAELQSILLYQISALKGMTESLGAKLHHVKPHGSLYNFASRDEGAATEIVEAILKIDEDLILYAPQKSSLAAIAKRKGLSLKSEVFADRCYEEDLSLRSRSLKGAVFHHKKEVLAQLEMIVEKGKVRTFGGTSIPIIAETICLHSDTKASVVLAKDIHDLLKSKDVEITAD